MHTFKAFTGFSLHLILMSTSTEIHSVTSDMMRRRLGKTPFYYPYCYSLIGATQSGVCTVCEVGVEDIED